MQFDRKVLHVCQFFAGDVPTFTDIFISMQDETSNGAITGLRLFEIDHGQDMPVAIWAPGQICYSNHEDQPSCAVTRFQMHEIGDDELRELLNLVPPEAYRVVERYLESQGDSISPLIWEKIKQFFQK